MKILHFYKTFPPDSFGGVEKVIEQLALGLAHVGIESEVLSLTKTKKNGKIEVNGCNVHFVPQLFEIASSPFSINVFKKFAQLAENADIIHYHFPWPFADVVHFATQLSSGIRKPAIVTYHSDIIKQKTLLKVYQPLMNRFLSDVDHIVATSPNYLETSPVLSKFSTKVSVVPIGLNEASYPSAPAEKTAYWKKRFPGKFFLFIGSIRYYKGLDFLIHAAQRIGAPILVIGSSASLEHKLKAKAAQLGAHNVHFLGSVSEEDKVALLELSYGVVLPSHLRSEAFGISLLEGAMFGKPMVCCEIGTGTTYINIHNETGLAVPPENPEALTQALQFLLDKPGAAQKMGKQARNRYLTHFTEDKMVASYADIYESVLKKSRGIGP